MEFINSKYAGRAMRVRLDPRAKQLIVDGMWRSEQNGERVFGPPENYDGPEPPFGCEVFVRRLPKSACEFELSALFERVGRIYQIRIRIDKSYHPQYRNFGCAFVQYFTPEDAARAVTTLNNCHIRQKRSIRVDPCINNSRLFLGKIPKTATRDEILSEMQRLTPGIARLILTLDIKYQKKNPGFAFLEYDNHRFAMMALRIMKPKTTFNRWGSKLNVAWAKEIPELHKLLVNNLPKSVTKEAVAELFNENSNNGVKTVYQAEDRAHVVMHSFEQARQAMVLLDKTFLLGHWLDVQMNASGQAELAKLSKVDHVKNIRTTVNLRRQAMDLNSQSLMPQFPINQPTEANDQPLRIIPINLPPILQVRRDLHIDGIQQENGIYGAHVVGVSWRYCYVYPTVYVADVNNTGSIGDTNGGGQQQLAIQFRSEDTLHPIQQ